MPFSFPASPSVGDRSTQNGRVFVWDGYAWGLASDEEFRVFRWTWTTSVDGGSVVVPKIQLVEP